MNLWAISDLHVGYEVNRRAVGDMRARPDDWLIIAGDTGETPQHLDFVLRTLAPRFAQLVWTPGNHDLWTPRALPPGDRGEGHYQRLVDICRRYGVLTPEDPYAIWPGGEKRIAVVPTFVLYDYTFRPDDVSDEHAVAWAAEAGIRCADEELLAPDPHPSREAWCHERVALTEQRLEAIPQDVRIALVNHFPLRRADAVLPRIPRFSIWCGTRQTEAWHRRYPIDAVIFGHLHMRSSRQADGVRFEEVSLGYPKQWDPARGIDGYLRKIA